MRKSIIALGIAGLLILSIFSVCVDSRAGLLDNLKNRFSSSSSSSSGGLLSNLKNRFSSHTTSTSSTSTGILSKFKSTHSGSAGLFRSRTGSLGIMKRNYGVFNKQVNWRSNGIMKRNWGLFNIQKNIGSRWNLAGTSGSTKGSRALIQRQINIGPSGFSVNLNGALGLRWLRPIPRVVGGERLFDLDPTNTQSGGLIQKQLNLIGAHGTQTDGKFISKQKNFLSFGRQIGNTGLISKQKNILSIGSQKRNIGLFNKQKNILSIGRQIGNLGFVNKQKNLISFGSQKRNIGLLNLQRNRLSSGRQIGNLGLINKQKNLLSLASQKRNIGVVNKQKNILSFGRQIRNIGLINKQKNLISFGSQKRNLGLINLQNNKFSIGRQIRNIGAINFQRNKLSIGSMKKNIGLINLQKNSLLSYGKMSKNIGLILNSQLNGPFPFAKGSHRAPLIDADKISDRIENIIGWIEEWKSTQPDEGANETFNDLINEILAQLNGWLDNLTGDNLDDFINWLNDIINQLIQQGAEALQQLINWLQDLLNWLQQQQQPPQYIPIYISYQEPCNGCNEEEIELYIYCWDSVPENITFPVIVADEITEDGMYNPIEGAMVEFNGETNLTNESGITTFVAPEVDENTTFEITAHKEGYTDATMTITIVNVEQDVSPLYLLCWDSVPENFSFPIIVADYVTDDGRYSPVENATVMFNNETMLTNESGIAIFVSPEVSENTTCIIEAYKEGYSSANKTIVVEDIKQPLYIILLNDTVEENSTFIIIVASYVNFSTSDYLPVEDAVVEFNGETNLTNESGITTFVAPEVDENTTFEITAQKEGYIEKNITLTIKNIEKKDTEDQPLYIYYSPKTVFERSEFVIVVADYITEDGEYYSPVEKAMVTFDRKTNLTNETGVTLLVAPEVDEDKSYKITVYKDGYEEIETTLTVKDIDGTDPEENVTEPENHSILYVFYQDPLFENQPFMVVVADNVTETENGTILYDPVINATVKFNNETKYTDINGSASFVSPSVDGEANYTVVVAKEGYNTVEKTVKIIDSPLTIDAPTYINETEKFKIMVKLYDEPVVAYVIFNDTENYTDENGELLLKAPEVENDTMFNITVITVYNDTYIYGEVKILIKNKEIQARSTLSESWLSVLLGIIVALLISLACLILMKRRKTMFSNKEKIETFAETEENIEDFQPIEEDRNEKTGDELLSETKETLPAVSDTYLDKVIDSIIKKNLDKTKA